ncbi:helix-turn-helix domain-containing protein [Acaryochloris marina NIES-2412]|uniref:helix-turn-helix domain-containing protein n=1 Tax=Acaryochloris marina TaxID=155978 RepID=UPI004059AF18
MKNTVKTFVDEMGITPYRFCKDTKIAQKTAYDLYNNPEHVPSSEVLTKICDRYKVQPEKLIRWVEKGDGGQA